ncbi:kinase-like domain-containing protein [Gorgonomyces haynaldii]|nr:kinase-like domain-containing protein [Gorgonomyces haynaldii]
MDRIVDLPTHSDNWDDHEGYYRIILGEQIDGRYRVEAILGKGVFSTVARAKDKEGNPVAVKFVRNNDTMYKAGLKEIQILKKLRENDPDDKMHVIRLKRHFMHKHHLCMVFESLDLNLRDLLKKYGKNVGLKMKPIRLYSHQLFSALVLLKKCEILHADIKPDNILVSPDRMTIKLADFGSASDVTENEITPYLVSRFYRAPEIILGLTYGTPIDVWSVGCTLYELATGKLLFNGRNNNHMLQKMMHVMGKMPRRLQRQGQFSPMHFDQQFNFLYQDVDKISQKSIIRTQTINKPVEDLKSLIPISDEFERQDTLHLIDLLDKCLQLSPEKRISPEDALIHPFISR